MHTGFKTLIILLLLTIVVSVHAQYYTSGSDPASLKWSKIETENFKLVFPRSYEESGQYLAKVLEEVYKYGTKSLKHQPRKISVLVHPETAYSNGFVTWAPRRIELFPTPNQSMHAQEWLQQLAIHEFRHVVQIDKLNSGFTKVLGYVLGEQAVGAVLGLYVPMWFLEGDAVTTETALTQSGRGRSPWFEQGMRAQVMEKGIYSYDKAYFGSYKHYVPNYYEMGYQLVAGARAKYGTDIWENALYNTGRNSFAITPFNKGQKKISGLNKTQLYYTIFQDLDKSWVKQDQESTKNKFTAITSIDESYLDFNYPIVMEDGTVLAELSSPGVVDQIVEVDSTGDYRKVFVPGSRSDEPFSYANNMICWAENIPDLRWENRAYSNIRCYDLNKKKIMKVTRKSRYFSPALSPDSKMIATIYADTKNNYSLAILDRITGDEVNTFKHGNNDYLFTPSWSEDGDKIVCVAMSDLGKEIVVLDVNTGEWSQVLESTFDDISLPKIVGDYVYFTAGFAGTQEIFRLDVNNKMLSQITQSKYGASNGTFDKQSLALVYCNYTADGNQLVKANNQQLINVPIEQVSDKSIKLYEKIAVQEEGCPDFSMLEEVEDYQVKNYSKWNLFNFHSWAPAFINVNDEEVNAGATALSQNLLGTTVTSIGYNGDSQKSREKYYFNFQYTGWFPELEFEVKHGDENIKYDALYASSTDIFSLYCDTKEYQTEVEVGLSLPLSLTSGKYYRLLQPSIDYNLYHRSGYSIEKQSYTQVGDRLVSSGETSTIVSDELNYSSFEYSLYYYQLMRMAERDATYRWGQLIDFKYQNMPWGSIDVGAIAGVRARFYFPGFMKHHSWRIDNEYQYKWDGDEYDSDESEFVMNYKYGNYFDFARGYDTYSNDRLYSLKTDYIFPLVNPDLSVPGIFYLKRITTNLFFDYTKSWEDYTYKDSGESFTVEDDFKSVGAEFLAEVNVVRFLFPLSVGYRYSYLIDFKQNKHELLLSLDISGFSVGE